MHEPNDNSVDKTPAGPLKKLLMFVGGFLFLVFLLHYGIKTFRNNDYRELSERFIRGNEFIRSETGGITHLSSGSATRNQDGEWVMKRTATGPNKKLLVTVFMYCNEGGNDPGVGCTIKRATSKAEADAGEPSEIPRAWYENFLIVYQ
jgi:hypothetical protein